MSNNIIPHSRPTLSEEEALAAAEAVRSGYITQGKKVREFEIMLAEFIGVKDAVVVSSGTAALHLALLALDIGDGDEVLLPSYVCASPINAIYMTGAEPILSDIEVESLNMLTEDMKSKKTSAAKAVILPHMFGNPADVGQIEELGVPVIEDCAHSIGARYGKKKAGSVGSISIFSFYVNKMMACGEGGALLSDDEGLLAIARDLRDYDEREDYKLRYNYKMTDVQASIGISQLEKVPQFIKRRKEIAKKYDKAFGKYEIKLPRGEFDHIYYRYVIRVNKDVNETITLLSEKGVAARKPVRKPLHRYFNMRSGFRNTDEAYTTALSIPIYPSLSDEDQERVIEAVLAVCG